jgi:AcrR family transcriptional regulator
MPKGGKKAARHQSMTSQPARDSVDDLSSLKIQDILRNLPSVGFRSKESRSEDTKSRILSVAQQLITTSQSVTARNITQTAGVADGLIVHHFGSYAGLVAELTGRLNRRYAVELGQFATPAKLSRLDVASSFFTELAGLDLNPSNRRLRRMSCRMSWDWNAADEQKLAGSVLAMLQPLALQLKLPPTTTTEDLLMALWAIYLLPLRLALIGALLPASVVNTEENLVNAIIEYVRPKFALVLNLDQ